MGYDDRMGGPSRGSRGGDRHAPYGRGRGDRRDDYDEEVIEISTNRLYVHNLSWRVSWQDLKDHFRQAGDVIHTKILTEGPGGRSKGCGIVEMDTVDSAANAIEMLNDTDLQGRNILIREDREDNGGRRGFGGGGGGGGFRDRGPPRAADRAATTGATSAAASDTGRATAHPLSTSGAGAASAAVLTLGIAPRASLARSVSPEPTTSATAAEQPDTGRATVPRRIPARSASLDAPTRRCAPSSSPRLPMATPPRLPTAPRSMPTSITTWPARRWRARATRPLRP